MDGGSGGHARAGVRAVGDKLWGVHACENDRGAPGGGLVFFAGNLIWMLATVGLLFHDTPTRLCASYLMDDQRLTGIGLVAYAIAVAIGIVLHLRRLPGFGFSFLAQDRDTDEQ